jgi:hypothetical protein
MTDSNDQASQTIAFPIRKDALPLSVTLIGIISALAIIPGIVLGIELQMGNPVYKDGGIAASVSISDTFPGELVSLIDKGAPISVEYTIELWRHRPGWFDARVAGAQIQYKIRYDSWDKEYTIVREAPGELVENTLDDEDEALEMISSSESVTLPTGENSGAFYLVGSVIIKTMNFSNFKEVESWLRGEVSTDRGRAIEDAPDRMGEFLFGLALKVSGLKNYSAEARSEYFDLERHMAADTLDE